jgi:hypothetical protein
MRDVLSLLVIFVVVGGALYLFNMLPIDATVKKVFNVLLIVVLILWAIKWLMGHV